MATNSSNGDHQLTTKQPPQPSPLRFSKFFQVNRFMQIHVILLLLLCGLFYFDADNVEFDSDM